MHIVIYGQYFLSCLEFCLDSVDWISEKPNKTHHSVVTVDVEVHSVFNTTYVHSLTWPCSYFVAQSLTLIMVN